MVLQRQPSNYPRPHTQSENNHPASSKHPLSHPISLAKSITSRLRTTLQDASRRRRARVTGGAHSPRYAVEQAKRRSTTRALEDQESVKVSVALPLSVGMQAGDVEMKEAESPMITPHPTLHPATRITLPRNLTRPPYREVSKAAIGAVDPDLEDTDLEYIREGLAEFGHGMLQVLAAARTPPLPTTTTLPKSLTILLHPQTPALLSPVIALPTHVLAIYGPAPMAGSSGNGGGEGAPARRRVTLFPVHSIVLAAHCANLPPMPAVPAPAPDLNSNADSNPDSPDPTSTHPNHSSESSQRNLTPPSIDSNPSSLSSAPPLTALISLPLPILPLCIPSPATFPVLAAYLYTKRADVLLAALFPCAPPTDVVADICRGADLLLPASSPSDTTSPATDAPTTPTSALAAFTVHLRATYTPRALMGALGRVHGVWANACALGVVCDGTYPGAGDGTGVWGVMEGAWRVLVGGLGGV